MTEPNPSKITALIVDDEPLAREVIRMLLQKDREIEILGECASGREAIEFIHNRPPDLLFLDVQMPEMNGFEMLKRLRVTQYPIIVFVTAYDRYALRAFEVNALDYLLKPFDDKRFAKTLSAVKAQWQKERAGAFNRRLLDMLDDYRKTISSSPSDKRSEHPANKYLDRLAVKSGDRTLILRVDEIDWIEAADYYVEFHVGNRAYLLRETMKAVEERLDPSRFTRIHRSTIVNLDRIKEIHSDFHGDQVALLRDGTRLRISRSRRDHLAATLGRFR